MDIIFCMQCTVDFFLETSQCIILVELLQMLLSFFFFVKAVLKMIKLVSQ